MRYFCKNTLTTKLILRRRAPGDNINTNLSLEILFNQLISRLPEPVALAGPQIKLSWEGQGLQDMHVRNDG